LPVEDEINLNDPEGITQDDLDIMNREADELEELAENAEKNAEKIKKATDSLKGMDFATKNIIQSEVEGTPTDMGAVDMSQRIESLEKQVEQLGTHVLSNTEEHKSNKSEIDIARQHRMEIERSIQDALSKGFGKVQEGFSFMNNPIGKGKQVGLGLLAKSSIGGAVAVMILEQVQALYNQIITQIKDMYSAGGVLDVRKDQLDSLSQVASLESVINMEQGRVLFTSDTGEILRQGVPQATNTQGRVNGYKQYLQEYQR
jgi:hypothetical protein|tara:strand:+ start:5355 stop:6131 length:777 start_codon:yes stop_codon:yes gene_type:complete